MGRPIKNGLKYNWFKKFIIPLIIINILIGIIAYYFIKDYYYSKASEVLRTPLMEVSGIIRESFDDVFNPSISDYVVENFKYKSNIAIEIINLKGAVISTSEIRTPHIAVESKDYIDAINGKIGYSILYDKYTSEKIMSYSSPIIINGSIQGVVRFKTSMSVIDAIVTSRMFIVTVILGFVIVFSYVMSSLFIKSITIRLDSIIEKSEKIGKGDHYEVFDGLVNDEIDILSEKLDIMGGEIKRTQKLKDEFMASVTHELKTPLTSIIGWTQYILMDESEESSEINETLKIIHNESSRLRDMVERLLDFSRYELREPNLHIKENSITSLIDEVVTQFEPIFRFSKIKYMHDCDKELKCQFDFDMLRQIMINIIDNSVNHGKCTKINIKGRKHKNKIVIMISDNGVGIDKNDMSKIKESFYSGSNSSKGTGIGLSISEKIIKYHNGQINIKSRPGKGTRSFIVLFSEYK